MSRFTRSASFLSKDKRSTASIPSARPSTNRSSILVEFVCFFLPVATYYVRTSGSSSDYGIAKAMKETTLAMLQENGMAFAAQEKENNKVSGVGCCCCCCCWP